MHMQTAQFGAAVQLREHLARVEPALGIERALHPHLLGEIAFIKHGAHQVALLDADAVLAGRVRHPLPRTG